MTTPEEGLKAAEAFRIALRFAISEAMDNAASKERFAKLHDDYTALALDRDAIRRERDNLRSEVTRFRAGAGAISTLYRVATSAQLTLARLGMAANRRSVKPAACAAYAMQLDRALVNAGPYSHDADIPF